MTILSHPDKDHFFVHSASVFIYITVRVSSAFSFVQPLSKFVSAKKNLSSAAMNIEDLQCRVSKRVGSNYSHGILPVPDHVLVRPTRIFYFEYYSVLEDKGVEAVECVFQREFDAASRSASTKLNCFCWAPVSPELFWPGSRHTGGAWKYRSRWSKLKSPYRTFISKQVGVFCKECSWKWAKRLFWNLCKPPRGISESLNIFWLVRTSLLEVNIKIPWTLCRQALHDCNSKIESMQNSYFVKFFRKLHAMTTRSDFNAVKCTAFAGSSGSSEELKMELTNEKDTTYFSFSLRRSIFHKLIIQYKCDFWRVFLRALYFVVAVSSRSPSSCLTDI